MRRAWRSCAYRGACLEWALSLPSTEVRGVWAGITMVTMGMLRRDGEVVTSEGDSILFDAASGEVVIVEGPPVPPPGKARAVLEAMAVVVASAPADGADDDDLAVALL